MKNNDRIVYKTDKGWANKRVTSGRVATYSQTQAEAESIARSSIVRSGGGELITKGLNGKIRSKDTIGGGNDPRSIRDYEH